MRVPESRLDTLARGIASGALSRREALRLGGAALVGAAAISPADALARITHHCPHGHVHCAGKCCPPGEVCLPPKHKRGRHACGCPNHKHRCGSKCVELSNDPHNCGACGHACASGQPCDAGQCVSQCPSGKTECNGGCVDTTSDAGNCGTCGHSCGANATCVNSQCACANGTTLCNGACVNLQTDMANCGACGTSCNSLPFVNGPFCNSGKCDYQSCSGPWANCSGNHADGCPCLVQTGQNPCNPNGTCMQT